MIKEEFNRSLVNKRFVVGLIAQMILLMIGLADYTSGFYFLFRPWPEGYPITAENAYDAVIWSLGQPTSLFVALIATLPFSSSLVADRQSGYIRFILIRAKRRQYLSAKFIANLVAGGLIISTPIIILFLITNILYVRELMPVDGPTRLGGGPSGLFSSLYHTNPDVYILTVIMKCFLFGAVYSTLGMALSTFIENKYIVLTTPFIIYIVTSLMFGHWGPMLNFDPAGHSFVTPSTTLIPLGIIFFISILLIFLPFEEE